MQCLEEVGHVDDATLEQIADALAAAEQFHRVLDVDMRRQHEDRNVGQLAADHLGGVQALGRVGGRHPDIGHHQVGDRVPDQGEQLATVTGLPDDGETRAGQQARHTFPKQHVVIGDDDARPLPCTHCVHVCPVRLDPWPPCRQTPDVPLIAFILPGRRPASPAVL